MSKSTLINKVSHTNNCSRKIKKGRAIGEASHLVERRGHPPDRSESGVTIAQAAVDELVAIVDVRLVS
jgi:hypothetical protein